MLQTDINADIDIWPAGEFVPGPPGGGIPVGADLILTEANGFATDFLTSVSDKRVAVKVSNVVTEYNENNFYANAGTSSKQVYTSDGVLGWSPHNMFLRSQEFNINTPWNPTTALTITPDAITAPDGTMTADRIVETAINGNHQLIHANIGSITGATYTVSVYAKAGERNWLSLMPANSNPANWFDLANGVLGASNTDSPTITSVGNGWYRCTITWIAVGATVGPCIFLRTADGQTATYTGDITKGLYLWGAQLNRGSTPLPYLPTTTAARYGLALDTDPVTLAAKGLQCEPAATNLLLRNSEFDNASWTKVWSTISANAVTAPDGSTTADAHIPNNGSGTAYMNQSVTTVAATAYTYSAYVKNGSLENNWFQLMVVSTTTWRAWFNLATGVKGTSAGSPTSYNMTDVGNGWYRCDMTVTAGTTTANCYLIANNADGSTGSVTGDGVSPAFYCWGAQLETGTVATSPIPTFAASATRAADAYQCTSAQINYSATAGGWWCENYLKSGPGGRLLSCTNAAVSLIWHNGTSAYFMSDGTSVTKAVASLYGVTHKVATAYQSADRAITADGLTVVSDAGAVTNLLTPGVSIWIGRDPSGAGVTNSYIRKIYYVPRRMTNTELQDKTV